MKKKFQVKEKKKKPNFYHFVEFSPPKFSGQKYRIVGQST